MSLCPSAPMSSCPSAQCPSVLVSLCPCSHVINRHSREVPSRDSSTIPRVPSNIPHICLICHSTFGRMTDDRWQTTNDKWERKEAMDKSVPCLSRFVIGQIIIKSCSSIDLICLAPWMNESEQMYGLSLTSITDHTASWAFMIETAFTLPDLHTIVPCI